MSEVPRPEQSDGEEPLLEITGDDAGEFVVETLSGGYRLDLSERLIGRWPRTRVTPTITITWTFDIDGYLLPLVELGVCRVGERMRAVVIIDGVEQPLRSSVVQTITRSPKRDP